MGDDLAGDVGICGLRDPEVAKEVASLACGQLVGEQGGDDVSEGVGAVPPFPASYPTQANRRVLVWSMTSGQALAAG